MSIAPYECMDVWIVFFLETKELAHVLSTIWEFKKSTAHHMEKDPTRTDDPNSPVSDS